MYGGARSLTANPTGISASCRNFPIQRGRKFHRDKRQTASDEFGKCLIECSTLLLQNAGANFDSRPPQRPQSVTGNQRIGVFHACNDLLDTCGDQRASARRSSSLMIAGFQIDIKRRALSLAPGFFERNDFCVVAAGELVKTRSDDFPIAYQHRTDHWVGTGSPGSLFSQTAGQPQIPSVNSIIAPQHRHLLVSFLSRATRPSCGYFFSFL